MNIQDEALLTLVGGPDAVTRHTKPRDLDRLPTEFVSSPDNQAVLARLGFTIGEVVDDLFTEVTAPSGWGLISTDHYMYSDVVDDQGRIRGRLGYKGAFYDRWCGFHFLTRYTIDEIRPDNWWDLHRPKRLTRTVRRRVQVQPNTRSRDSAWDACWDPNGRWSDSEFYADSDDRMFVKSGLNRVYPVRFEMRNVEEELPEDQQPQPQAYDKAFGILDRATGAFVFHSAFYSCEPDAHARNSAAEAPLREDALAQLKQRFPDHNDVVAYW